MRKRFNTMFSTNGWFSLYLTGMVLNLVMSFATVPLPYLMVGSPAFSVLSLMNIGIAFVRALVLAFFISAAYTKAILLFINTLSLEGKRFSTKLEHKDFFLFVFANIIISIFTLGIYIPWAYKGIIDKLTNTIEYEGGGRFSFLSKASQLFLVVFISVVVIFVISTLLVISIALVASGVSIFGIIIVPISIVLFFAVLAVVVFLQVYTLNWYCNIGFASPNKDVTYSLNINIASAIVFYLGQTILLVITLGFYAGVYILSIYEYFASRIVEKKGDEQTGCILFVKPLNKGAGFLLLQAIFSILTAGIYTPFAYVEYAKFFVNNTYLDTKYEEEQQTEETALPQPTV